MILMNIQKIYILACVHGNETFGLKVLEQLHVLKNSKIKTRIAHEQAIVRKKRHIQTDLNRSFQLDPTTSLEAKIARDIRAEIKGWQPDLVIDLHTSTVKVGKVAILCQENQLLIKTAKQLGMENIAIMPKNITCKSAIGVLPERSICIELGRGNRSVHLAREIAANINALTFNNNHQHSHQIPLFKVKRVIQHQEANGIQLSNYIFNQKLNGYPFLTGESNYTQHRGFLATAKIEV